MIHTLARRPYVIWATVLTLAAAGMLILAYRASGYPVTHVSLNDGGIWVTKNNASIDVPPVARFDKPVEQLGEGLTPPNGAQAGYSVDVLQSGSAVLLLDARQQKFFPIDTTMVRAAPSGGISITCGSSDVRSCDPVALGGDVVAVLHLGKLWVAPVAEIQDANPEGAPAKSRIGGTAAVAVGLDGTVYAASAETHRLYTLQAGATKVSWISLPTSFNPPSTPQITVVGSTPVVLDPQTGAMLVGSHPITTTLGTSSGDYVLQQPGPNADHVLVASSNALFSVPLGGGQAKPLTHTKSAPSTPQLPAAPVRLDGCDYGAWAGSKPWVARACDELPLYQAPLSGRNSTAVAMQRLVFRVNNGLIVLNDPDNGYVWEVGDKKPHDNWNALRSRQIQHNPNTNQSQAQQDAKNLDPVAKPDPFGVRFGQSTIIHPLDNDHDPNKGDILAITQVSGLDNNAAHVQIVDAGQALKITVSSRTETHFRYAISDGRGGSASALDTVTVTAKNTKPYRVEGAPKSAVTVAPHQTIAIPILTDWRDHEGDPLFISSAKAAGGGTLTVLGPSLTYTAPATPGTRTLTYWVSDGFEETPLHIAVTVLGPKGPAERPIAMPDVVDGESGSAPIVIHPLANDVPGADPTQPHAQLQLVGQAYALQAGVTVTTNTDDGTVTATAKQAGTYLISYEAAFGSSLPVFGRIRLDVSDPGAPQQPIALPDVAVLHGADPVIVDPLSNDTDPQGQLLVVQSATVQSETANSAAIDVSVEHHHWLVLRAAPGGSTKHAGAGAVGSQSFIVQYTVTDGRTAPVTGDVAVHVQAERATASPITVPDQGRARGGSSTEVAVLANDIDPQGQPLSLLPGKLDVSGGKAAGTAWAVNGVVRYVAPQVKTRRKIAITYVALDAAGNRASGDLTITVEPPPTHNEPPSPLPQEVRVNAGQQVTIPIPIFNIDPDGDVANVIGIAAPPRLGRIVEFKADSIVYQAYPRSRGADGFTYEVADPSGQTGTATVRLTVAPLASVPPPIANDVKVNGDLNAEVRVDVLASGLIAPGDPVRISLAPGANRQYAHVKGNRLVMVAAPKAGVSRTVSYVLTGGAGATSQARATITAVTPWDNAPLARDDYVQQQARGVPGVTVNVRANDDDPDNARSELSVTPVVDPRAHSAGPGKLRITLGPVPRLVAYEVSDGKESSQAFVHVPARTGSRPTVRPTLRPGVPPIHLSSGGSKTISIATYVVDPAGPVRLTTLGTLQSSPAGKVSVTAPNDKQLVITSNPKYHGPGSVSFEVTDGKTLGAAGAHVAVLTLPVNVGSGQPVLHCPYTPFPLVVGRAALHLDLATACQVWMDDYSKLGALTFKADFKGSTNGLELKRDLSGRGITIRAGTQTAAGKTVLITVTAAGSPVAGVIAVRAVNKAGSEQAGPQAHKPGAPTAPHADATGSEQIRLTWNDPPNNGLPIEEYNVADDHQHTWACKGGSPCDITTQLKDGTSYSFRVQARNAVGWGAFSKSSNAVTPHTIPGTVSFSAGFSGVPDDEKIRVSWAPPSQTGGSPITGYDVSLTPGAPGSRFSVTQSSATFSNLTNGTPYSVSVRAKNSAGSGAWSRLSPAVVPFGDPLVMPAPTASPANSANPGDTVITVNWTTPPGEGNGREVVSYIITPQSDSSSAGAPVEIKDPSATSATLTVPNQIASWTYTIVAFNSEGRRSKPSAASSLVQAATRPAQMAQPSATDNSSGVGLDSKVNITFTTPANGVNVNRVYWQSSDAVHSGYFPVGSVGANVTLTQTITGLSNGSKYTFQLEACNDLYGCSVTLSPPSNEVSPYTTPTAPTASASANGTTITYGWSGGASGGRPITYQISVDGGAWTAVSGSPGSQVTNYPNQYNKTVTFQARVVDSVGQISASNIAQATTTAPPPPPALFISRGGKYGPNGNCGDASCAFVNVQASHFPAGASLVLGICLDGGSCAPYFGPYYADGNGNYTLNNWFYFGFPGHTATVRENNTGVVSNGIPW